MSLKKINSEKQQIWQKAQLIQGKKPEIWRKDSYNNKIHYNSYGTQGQFGWEIDHKTPKSKGGSDQKKNLQPLHWKENWKENRKKGAKKTHKGK